VIDPRLAPLLDLAAAGAPLLTYERALFEALDGLVGFDVAFCARAGGMGPHAPGFDARVRSEVESQLDDYAVELHAIRSAARQAAGVAVDREVLGAAPLARTRTYREIMQPHHGRCSLHLYLGDECAPAALLVLGRTRNDFRARDIALMQQARALLTVCERALSAVGTPAKPQGLRLTPREREILSYLRLGYSNPQIAAASGTSFRTVRNQLSLLFDKLEVATRAEAVARSYELRLPLA